MAKLGGVTINVGINISDETANRCCQILQMYLADNPDKIVVTEQGEYPTVWIANRQKTKAEIKAESEEKA